MVYPSSVRRRIIEMLFHGHRADEISAGSFAPSRRTVYRVRRMYHDHGLLTTAYVGRRPGRVGKIPSEIMDDLIDHLYTTDCTLYLDEMSDFIFQRHVRLYAAGNIGRRLRRMGITRKMLTRIAEKRDEFERASFDWYLSFYTPDQCIYIDETRKDPRTEYRTHGRSQRNMRAFMRQEFTRAAVGFSALGVMGLDGMIDCAITRATGVDADRFVHDFYYHVLPHLQPYPLPRSVVIFDNAQIHLDPRIDAMVRAAGALIVPLPAWSYDKNPIEKAFSKAKAFLRRHRTLAFGRPRVALRRALMSVSASDARGYFRSCGWDVG